MSLVIASAWTEIDSENLQSPVNKIARVPQPQQIGLIPSCCKSAVDPSMRLWTFVFAKLLLPMELVLLMICEDRLVCSLSQTTYAY